MAVTFPALVYKGGGPYLAPGGYYDYKQVVDQAAYDAALAAGWKASLSEVVTNPYGMLPDPTRTAPGTILSQDGVEYICDGVNWDALSIKDYTADTLPDPASLPMGQVVNVGGRPNIAAGTELVSLVNNKSNSFAVIGDSYFANLVQSSSATVKYWNNFSPLYHAFGMCERRVDLVSFNATGGTGYLTGTNTFGKQLTTAIESGAKNIIFMGGVNDIHNDKGFDNILAEAKKFLARIKAAGMRLFLCTQPGPSSGYAFYSFNHTGQMQRLNDFLRQYAAQNDSTDVVLVDLAAIATDPASSSMSYKTGYAATDNIHPINFGCYYMGKELADKIKANIPAVGGLSNSNYATYTYNSNCPNMLTNGLFIDGASGAPTGWTIINDSGVTTGTKASTPRADGFGNDLVIPITSITTAGNGIEVTNTTGITTGVNDGDEFYLELEATLTSPVAMRGFWLRFAIYCATKNLIWNAGFWQADSPIPNVTTTYQFRSLTLKYDAATMGALTDGLKVHLKAIGDSTASSCGSVSFGRISIKKVIN